MQLTVPAETLLHNIEFAEEDITDNPKSIRLERQDFSETGGSTTYLQEVTRYLPRGKITERYFYRPEGTLSVREVYEYGEDGRLRGVSTFDQTGTLLCVKNLRSPEKGAEEAVVLDRHGKKLDRTLAKLNEKGQVLEATSSSEFGQIHVSYEYDAQGRPIAVDVKLEGRRELSQRIEIKDSGNNHLAFSLYGPQGKLLARSETREEGDYREVSQLSLTEANARSDTTTEQIASRDPKGNWTKKVVLKNRGPGEPPEVIAEMNRAISYY